MPRPRNDNFLSGGAPQTAKASVKAPTFATVERVQPDRKVPFILAMPAISKSIRAALSLFRVRLINHAPAGMCTLITGCWREALAVPPLHA